MIASVARVLANRCNGRVKVEAGKSPMVRRQKPGQIPAGSHLQARAESPHAEASLQEILANTRVQFLPAALAR